jgi:hypothetical protein
MTRLSCHRFRSNEVRLWLSVIASHLGNLWRRLVLPESLRRARMKKRPQRRRVGCILPAGREGTMELLAKSHRLHGLVRQTA